MKIAVLSDSHDHVENLRAALAKAKNMGCDQMIFLGDLVAPFSMRILLDSGFHINLVFGNNDGDIAGLIQTAKPEQVEVWGIEHEYGEMQVDNVKIAFCHHPKLAKLLAASGQYHAVFHGHTHQAYEEHVGDTVLGNPGSVCGIISGKPGPASFGVFDTANRKFELVHAFT
jgi:uncharacterized protein